ncbi:hypothetical protein KI387_006100, partial [Taxus chinensis]
MKNCSMRKNHTLQDNNKKQINKPLQNLNSDKEEEYYDSECTVECSYHLEIELHDFKNLSGTAAPGNSPEAEAEAEDDGYSHFCISNHEFILDEEIGIICRLCNFVKTDIKNVVAPF